MVGPVLAGERAHLRPLRDDDLPRRVEWLSDMETTRLFSGPNPNRAYDTEEIVKWRRNTESDPETLVWAVDTSDGQHIGDVDLHSIGVRGRSARLTILIGDKQFQGRGIGTDVIRTILRYAFTCLDLAGVTLNVFNFNGRAIRCYEKCGFRRMEAPRGRPNEVFMAVTRDQYMAENSDVGAVCAA